MAAILYPYPTEKKVGISFHFSWSKAWLCQASANRRQADLPVPNLAQAAGSCPASVAVERHGSREFLEAADIHDHIQI